VTQPALGRTRMSRLARVAVGTVQAEVDPRPMLWALIEALRRSGVQVQSFLSGPCLAAYQGAATVSGLGPRHMDAWLMSPEACRETFVRGSEGADLALVAGKFSGWAPCGTMGGNLETLCRWLDLPRLVILDAPGIDRCGLPDRPADFDGVLLDRVAKSELARLTTALEAQWGVPVVGTLGRIPRLRAQVGVMPCGGRPPREMCGALGNQFVRHWRPKRFWEIASRRAMPDVSLGEVAVKRMQAKLTVAFAYDEAFNCYFSDTLEWLEVRGASVVDFSPLRDEGLPQDTDVVYLGCGHPERHAAALSANHCMKAALRNHLRMGRRIYGEGGGLAYLCQQMETPQGELRRMVGIIPAIARLRRAAAAPTPLEVTITRPSWLGDKGARLRGYRNGHWDLEPVGVLADLEGEQKDHRLVGNLQTIGSLVHVDFAAQPELLRRFFYPRQPLADLPDPWAAVG